MRILRTKPFDLRIYHASSQFFVRHCKLQFIIILNLISFLGIKEGENVCMRLNLYITSFFINEMTHNWFADV